MALTRLTCTECNSVLRLAKAVEQGKKIRCPRCQKVFVARVDDEDDFDAVDEDSDERPRKPAKPVKKKIVAPPAKKKAAPAVKAPPPKKEEEEIYGYIKEEEEDEDDKPQINYAPDTSIRDLRGPAIVKLMTPASWLQMAGFIGFLGWMILLLIVVIPIVFPVEGGSTEKARPVMQIGPGLSSVNPGGGGGGFGGGFGGFMPPPGGGGGGGGSGTSYEEEKGAFLEVLGVDLVAYFLPLLPAFIGGMIFAGLVVAGSIKMQNLESRGWSYAGAIMVMFPFHVLGFYSLLSILLRYGLGMIIDDMDYLNSLANGISGLAYLGCVGIGIWCLVVLKDEDVIAGFEYKGE